MGSKTRCRNRIRRGVSRILLTAVRKPDKVLTDNQVRYLTENLPRHKCQGCGTGGHRRRAPVLVTGEGVRIRPQNGA